MHQGDGRIHDYFEDYFEEGVLGDGGEVALALHGTTPERPVLPISEVGRHPRRLDQVMRKVPDGAGGTSGCRSRTATRHPWPLDCARLRSASTEDGHALLFDVHLPTRDPKKPHVPRHEVTYPSSAEVLPGGNAAHLFSRTPRHPHRRSVHCG